MMRSVRNFILFICALLSTACSVQQGSVSANDEPLAFPGAEGYGKYTRGGRGGKVYIVSNLNDSGKGSFRDAAKAKEPRIIVFAVAGTIHLESPLGIQGNVTIAGQTAPGDGICIADHPVSLKGDNVIIRYMRFRLGDRYQNLGKVAGAGSDDALNGVGRKNIIIDHCSMSWSTDEVASFYAGDSITLQWNIISEPLNLSYHFEQKDFEEHGYGGIWGGKHATFHHNLFAHCASRTPRFDGLRNAQAEMVDFRNNLIYNWGSNNVYAGEGGKYNIVNNYYRPGPSTVKSKKSRLINPYKTDKIPFGKFFVKGNFLDDGPDINRDNSRGVIMNNGTEADKLNALSATEFEVMPVKTESALNAYRSVLRSAGASFRRDTLDQRIVRNVENKTGRIIDVQGGYERGTDYQKTSVAWPTLQPGIALPDTDNDGIPDDWERKNGLDPNDGSDSSRIAGKGHYTNIERYINSLTGI